ncbi:glutamine amidotransferase [Stackebrandtia soli]|uniref:glutamine amidotransferase n=1 Tax=Stackebrandtia soli TaxID=1892856 RepID=UPI0039EBB99E
MDALRRYGLVGIGDVGGDTFPLSRADRVGWPALLGFNRAKPKDGAGIPAEVNGHPLVAVASAGRGRTGVFTSDMSPHWAPRPFMGWPGHTPLWCAVDLGRRWSSGETLGASAVCALAPNQ